MLPVSVCRRCENWGAAACTAHVWPVEAMLSSGWAESASSPCIHCLPGPLLSSLYMWVMQLEVSAPSTWNPYPLGSSGSLTAHIFCPSPGRHFDIIFFGVIELRAPFHFIYYESWCFSSFVTLKIVLFVIHRIENNLPLLIPQWVNFNLKWKHDKYEKCT